MYCLAIATTPLELEEDEDFFGEELLLDPDEEEPEDELLELVLRELVPLELLDEDDDEELDEPEDEELEVLLVA